MPDSTSPATCNEMLDTLPVAVYAIDSRTWTVLYGNHLFCSRYPAWKTTPCHTLIHGLDAPCSHCRQADIFDATGQPNGVVLEYEMFNEFDDRWYQIQERSMLWEHHRPVHFVTTLDITALKQTQNDLAEAHASLMLKHQELEHLASTDTLTQINNREKLNRVFRRELERVQQGQRALSIISVDIDHFKQVNDTFGHATGDSVLIAVSRTMKNALRTTDTLGRWGGEEFLILCPEANHEDTLRLAERIRQAVAAGHHATRQPQTVSIGVATYREGDTLDSLLHRADLALYRAKQTGRNRVCGDETAGEKTPP